MSELTWPQRVNRRLLRVESVQYVLLTLFGVAYGPTAVSAAQTGVRAAVAFVAGVWP